MKLSGFVLKISTGVMVFVVSILSVPVAYAEGALPQLNPASYPSQLFWLFVSFSILYLVVHFFALPRIAHILQRRMRNIDADYSAARRFRREVDALANEAQEMLNQGRYETQELMRSKHQSLQTEIAKEQEQEQHKITVELGEHEQKVIDAKNDVLAKIDEIAIEITGKCVVLAGGSKPTKATINAALKDN